MTAIFDLWDYQLLLFISGIASYVLGVFFIPYLRLLGAFLYGFFRK